MSIKVKDVSKIYLMGNEKVHALDHANLHVKKGEFVSIIGPSGSGKSTMMNIIGCLDTADEGEYFLDRQPIKDYSEKELARIRNKKIGFVFQNFNLLPKMTAAENVELPLIYQRVAASKRKERVEEALNQQNFPVDSSKEWQSRVRLPRTRLYFLQMSRLGHSIPKQVQKSWNYFMNFMRREIPLLSLPMMRMLQIRQSGKYE